MTEFVWKPLYKKISNETIFVFFWNILYNCNLSCSYCYVSKKNEKMSLDQIASLNKVIRESLQGKYGALHLLVGGEPTLHPQLEDIVFELNTTGDVEILTNGLNLKRLLPIKDKVSIQISLHHEYFFNLQLHHIMTYGKEIPHLEFGVPIDTRIEHDKSILYTYIKMLSYIKTHFLDSSIKMWFINAVHGRMKPKLLSIYESFLRKFDTTEDKNGLTDIEFEAKHILKSKVCSARWIAFDRSGVSCVCMKQKYYEDLSYHALPYLLRTFYQSDYICNKNYCICPSGLRLLCKKFV